MRGNSSPRTVKTFVFRYKKELTMLLVVLIILIVIMFGGGFYSKGPYRSGGIGLGTVLLIILILWLLGVFGSRPF